MDEKLTEKAHKEFKEFMEAAKKSICQSVRDEIDSTLSTCYTDYGMYLESDAWINYREKLRFELQGGFYKQILNTEEGYWAKNVRDFIFQEHREELEKALNQDLVNEIESLKKQLDNRRNYY